MWRNEKRGRKKKQAVIESDNSDKNTDNDEEPQSQQRYSTRNSTRQNKHRHVILSVAKSRRGKRSRKLKK